ncbi:hypothetical protein BG844_18615 [Couchioplanes caeruleus subsp. caeruleus]|uniref:NTP pyrophosphohydrolase MazG-like domain-containing protein n=1 Tax=Couchioplanes caeruleus subsp. caeruleus TaxID=56427 RepID=A0A1K0GP03_9ACTN|nr:hypothetical protein BG844_18615 [Couchioplanes caeruleus subsp. caeruleus]
MRAPGLSLLHTSARLPADLLTREAWASLAAADVVQARRPGEPVVSAVIAAGLHVEVQDVAMPAEGLAGTLLDLASERAVIWLVSRDGDPDLTKALADESTRRAQAPSVRSIRGSWDPAGAGFLDLVWAMDRLRSPGGCPWDGAQTQRSLVPYLIEETYEAVEALETDARDDIVEELGDVLMQVVFLARIGAERADDPFDIDDVCAAIVTKLVGRQPGVFKNDEARRSGDPVQGWESAKAAEKPARSSPLDGIPAAMPTLERAVKILDRLRRAEADADLAELLATPIGASGTPTIGNRLLAEVYKAREVGVDPASELRDALRHLERRVVSGR